MKRFRRPKLKDGELRVYWGKLPHDSPDVIYSWQGDRSMRRDSALLHHYFGSQHPDPFTKPIFSKMNPSLIEELEMRGYDITTLRFSIQKKAASVDQPTDKGAANPLQCSKCGALRDQEDCKGPDRLTCPIYGIAHKGSA